MRIKAVTFDLDGTFYPYTRIFSQSLFLAVRHPLFFMHFARIRLEIRKIRPIKNFRKLQAQLLANRIAITYQESYDLIENLIYRKLIRAYKRIKPYPFLKETLFRLKGDGLKMGVLSDFPVESKLYYLGLNELWNCALCSEDSNYLKPNPEPFLMLSKCLNLPPEEILYVGDKYGYDIVGAHRAGMKAAHFARTPEPDGLADFTFYSYKNLKDLIIKSGR